MRQKLDVNSDKWLRWAKTIVARSAQIPELSQSEALGEMRSALTQSPVDQAAFQAALERLNALMDVRMGLLPYVTSAIWRPANDDAFLQTKALDFNGAEPGPTDGELFQLYPTYREASVVKRMGDALKYVLEQELIEVGLRPGTGQHVHDYIDSMLMEFERIVRSGQPVETRRSEIYSLHRALAEVELILNGPTALDSQPVISELLDRAADLANGINHAINRLNDAGLLRLGRGFSCLSLKIYQALRAFDAIGRLPAVVVGSLQSADARELALRILLVEAYIMTTAVLRYEWDGTINSDLKREDVALADFVGNIAADIHLKLSRDDSLPVIVSVEPEDGDAAEDAGRRRQSTVPVCEGSTQTMDFLESCERIAGGQIEGGAQFLVSQPDDDMSCSAPATDPALVSIATMWDASAVLNPCASFFRL